MKYIPESDYQYISNKYHDTNKPFDPFARFVRNDAIFAPETGMDGDAIRELILQQDAANAHLPHPVRKALALTFVLKNTRISCDRRDRFPALNAIDRPLNKTIISQWTREVFENVIPDVGRRSQQMKAEGVADIYPDYDHSMPIWERVFGLGLTGLLEESQRIRRQKERTAKEEAFFEGIRLTYEAVLMLVDRLAELAEKTEGSERMAKALRSLHKGAPSTFYEALLLDYIYFIVSEHIEGLQVRSICNFDRILLPYYENDLRNGVTQEEIRTDLAYFLMQFTAIGNYWNQPVFLGGCKEDESTEINALSYLFLDVYDQMNLYNPKIQIKLAESTPKDFVCKALDMIRRGNNCIVFVTDATVRKMLERAGFTREEARLCDIRGCYDTSIQGAMVTGASYINLMKPLEYALHEGCDGVTGCFTGMKSPAAEEYESFDAFYSEYKRQLARMTQRVMETVNGYDNYMAEMNPQSLLSATYPTCLERARDALEGGAAANDDYLNFGFLADIADSMAMIKKYVFDRGELTLPQLRDMLDRNYEGDERMRRRLLADPDKYGNNRDLPDFFAVDLFNYSSSLVCGKPNAERRGGKWNCGYHVARMSYTQAGNTAASPNGRCRGEELSKNGSASMGQNREGATAAILSITKMDASAITSNLALDMALLPSAVKGEEGLEAMYGLVMTFVRRGGHAIHINVFDAATLRDAQNHPEKYQGLQIRVCGWNVLWNNINKEEQDGFIKQAENLI